METTTITQKCRNCHGTLVFDTSKNALVCDRCGNSITVINNVTSTEKSFQDLLTKAPTWQKDTAVCACQNCGAKSVVSKFDVAIKCEYCGAETVNQTAELPGVRPDTVVLFKLNQTEAQDKLRTWINKRFFIPNEFKRMLRERQVSGVYYPAYTFDAQVMTLYNAVAVQTRTATTVINGEEISHSHTFSRPVSGVDEQTFDDLLVMANDEILPNALKKLEPFDTQNGLGFKQEYLSGFTVSQASKEPLQTWEDVKKTIEGIIRNKITARYSSFRLEDLKLEISITNITYKHVLLPVYVGHTEYHGTKYELYVNGQTGKVHGKAPRSRWKIFRFFALALLGGCAAIVLAMFL